MQKKICLKCILVVFENVQNLTWGKKSEIGKIRVGILLYTKNFFQHFKNWTGRGGQHKNFFPNHKTIVHIMYKLNLNIATKLRTHDRK